MSLLPSSKPKKTVKQKFPFEPIYTYPTVSQMGAHLEHKEVAIVGAAAFVQCCKESNSDPMILRITNEDIVGKSSVIDLTHIPTELQEFSDVFDKGLSDKLAPHRPYDLKIELEEGASPPISRIYPVSDSELETLKKFVEDHLRMGFIRPSSSPFAAPVLFIKKKSGELCLCMDFHGLNQITRKDRYSLPLITELLDTPRQAKIYTILDLQHAYHLARIAEGDKWKTAFQTRYRSFEWRVMPFRLTNAPAVFQRFINDIFSDLLDISVMVYLDDVLIFSDNEEIHKEHVKEVF